MHHAQSDHDIEEDREVGALEKQHICRLIGYVQRLVRVHEKHARNNSRRYISVLCGKKTVQHRKKQDHPHHDDHQFSRQDPVLDHLQDRKQDQVGRSHKKYCAVAHSGRKQLAALELLYRELNIKSTVRMEKSLRKFEDDPAHTHKEYHHTGQQDRISGSAKTCRCQSLRCGLLIRFGSFSGFAGGFSGALSCAARSFSFFSGLAGLTAVHSFFCSHFRISRFLFCRSHTHFTPHPLS